MCKGEKEKTNLLMMSDLIQIEELKEVEEDLK